MVENPAVGAPPRIDVAIVADSGITREALAQVIAEDPEIQIIGIASEDEAHVLLREPDLRVLVVNLALGSQSEAGIGLAFIRRVKAERPDIRIVSLKREVEGSMLRAALDAGADACCLATISQLRLLKAIKAVADGATWLDSEISRAVFPPKDVLRNPHLSPRERSILGLIVEGYSNAEIAASLACATGTVHTHVTHLFSKLGVNDRVSAAVCALRRGLIASVPDSAG
ncbi:MAG: response regulator transcription factor [Candidatus Velthaea sp.]